MLCVLRELVETDVCERCSSVCATCDPLNLNKGDSLIRKACVDFTIAECHTFPLRDRWRLSPIWSGPYQLDYDVGPEDGHRPPPAFIYALTLSGSLTASLSRKIAICFTQSLHFIRTWCVKNFANGGESLSLSAVGTTGECLGFRSSLATSHTSSSR